MGRIYYDPNDEEQSQYPSPGPTAEERKQARIKRIQRELAEWNKEWASADEETQADIASEIDKLEAELKRLQPPQVQPPQVQPRVEPRQAQGRTYAPWEEEEARLDIEKKRRDLLDAPTQKDLWERAYEERENEIARHQYEQQMEMTRRQNAWRAAMNMGDQQLRAAPMAAIPGQTHFLGYEPGGIAENIARLSGRSYNPDIYRAPIINVNPEDQWRKAWGIFGG